MKCHSLRFMHHIESAARASSPHAKPVNTYDVSLRHRQALYAGESGLQKMKGVGKV